MNTEANHIYLMGNATRHTDKYNMMYLIYKIIHDLVSCPSICYVQGRPGPRGNSGTPGSKGESVSIYFVSFII